MVERFERPESLKEALRLKAEFGADARPVTGGTDLLVKMRAGHAAPRILLDLTHIPRLNEIRRTKTELLFGATVTAAQCIRDPHIRSAFPALWRAAEWLGGPQMQHVGTLGGNLANASPAADTVPALMVAGAKVKLTSASASRVLAFEDFLVGPGRTVIAPDELVEEIRVPLKSLEPADPRPLLNAEDAFRLNVIPLHDNAVKPKGEFTTNMFYKAGARLAQVISIACMAGWARMRDGKVVDVRLAYGSAAPVTRRGLNAENAVRGKRLTPELVEEAVRALTGDIKPISDVRGSADYKRVLCENYTRAFLQDAAGMTVTGTAPRPAETANA